ncbi:MAG: LysM peptidoglycan-binding domain-containing protein [Erythrobacter sp.]
MNAVTSQPFDAARARPTSSAQPSPASYSIQRGDTLTEIAARFGTDVASLARLNGVTNPDRIFAGQELAIPSANTRFHTVSRGDTLGAIARGAGLSLAEVLRANPDIRNPDVIYPGQRIALPTPTPDLTTPDLTTPDLTTTISTRSAPSITADGVSAAGETSFVGGTLSLTPTDILNIKKTLQTEWVQSAGDAQAHGIIDTILNRTASGRWGGTVSEVVNAYNQFSDINGPISRRDQRTSVEQIPAAQISARVDQTVDSYLAERAAGRASSIGSHLNYANPNYSDARNLGWIMALDGPVLGRGDAIHRHGTTPELERFRPGEFAVALPGSAPVTGESPAPSGPFDGRALAAEVGVAIKSSRVDIDSLHPAMDPVIRAVAQAAERLGLPQPVITSGNDSSHSSGSLHYQDRALDFRGNNITDAQGFALQNEVRRILGNDYDVIFETFPGNAANDHLHVEYDPD